MSFRVRAVSFLLLAAVVWAGINYPWASPYAAGVLFGLLLLGLVRVLARAALRPRQRRPRRRPVQSLADVWDERVGCDKGVLPGSRLVDARKVKHGAVATVKLPPGRLTTDDAVKQLVRVASAFEVPVTAVAIEPGRKASEAKFLIIEDNPLDRAHVFPGPSLDPEEGTFDLGVYVDGAVATARLWRPKFGAVHMLLAGTTGAGKSSLFSIVLANAAYSNGLVVPWLIDPQGGQSMPEWVDHVDWAATSTQEGIAMLEAAKAVMEWRNNYMARVEWIDDHGDTRRGRSYFEPTPAMPLLSIVIDEAPQLLLDPRAVELVASLTKMGRKCGIQILLATQVPSVDELGGNSTIRDQLAGGMAVILRTGGATSSRMVF